MNYLLFEPEDFALDEFFCRWVLEPTPESEIFWRDWLNDFPGKNKEIEIARQLVLVATCDDEISPSQLTIDKIWEGIQNGKQTKVKDFQNIRFWMKLAAAITILCLAFAGYFYKRVQNHTYRTAFGESRRLSLPDGSLVTLNANSRLRISNRWGMAKEREVWIEGEAFFSVNKLKRSGVPVKFVVHTPDLDVEVKGTEFNVNTRKNQTQVVLSEGSINLHLWGIEKKNEIRMKPGDLVDFSQNNKKLLVRHLKDASPVFSWKNNRWTLNDTSLEEISSLIRETYGVTVTIEEDSLRRKKICGIVPTDNMDDLLSSLESILPITILHYENQLIIRTR
ncbi:FecR family protein [Dyadobacter sp. CY356]|uniref:FecR family protein n=1 Tax=Dyadobacter sp. CY356 TaxID=2906442 RepID=UPI001F40FFD5|nr:FecR domain-containing protein [Dyadobacter sp. CY356]MCF0054245.1 FecR domain-containing protein [Dyadobacter sp. CY356]